MTCPTCSTATSASSFAASRLTFASAGSAPSSIPGSRTSRSCGATVTHRPWRRYYDAAKDEPRDTLVFALDRFGAERGLAVDLGCGPGRDTLELLRRGWSVVAVDGEKEAITRLRARAGEPAGLETHVARFEDFRFPQAQLVNSSYALPFCPPDAFPGVWRRLVDALALGGRFAGHLFGDRDDCGEERRLAGQGGDHLPEPT